MTLQYWAVFQAPRMVGDPAEFREVATMAFILGANRDTVLAALVELKIGDRVPDIITTLRDLGKLTGLPGNGSSNDPDWSFAGFRSGFEVEPARAVPEKKAEFERNTIARLHQEAHSRQ